MAVGIEINWRADSVVTACVDVEAAILLEGNRREVIRAGEEGRVSDVGCGV